MKDLKLVYSVVFLLFTLSAHSQYMTDTIRIVSTQIPMKAEQTGRNITVISNPEILQTAANSIDELLQVVPGVEVQSRGGFGVQGDILLRGSTFTQVLILIDGMKMNDPLTGHFNSNIPVTPAEIDRIEILRGAAAAMYGADAVGGVIHIITKTFSNRKDEGLQLSGSLNYGAHKLVSGHQGFSVTKGKVKFSGGFSLLQSEGEFIPEQIIDTSTTLSAYNNHFDIKTAGAAFAYDLGKGMTLKARTAYDFRDFGARYFYTSSPFDKSEETVTNWWNHIQLSKSSGRSITDINAAYKYNTDIFIFSPDFPSTNNHITQYLNFTANHQLFISDELILKAGLQIDSRKIESNDRGDHKDLHYGLYAMGTLRKERTNITVSLRGDYDDNYKFELSPQANISYVMDGIVLRASAGKSIRAADYTERYVSNNLQNLTPGRSLGNPALEAERSWSLELGADVELSKSIHATATVFARPSTNLIDYTETNQTLIGSVSETGSLVEGENYFFARNIEAVIIRGFETAINLRSKLGDNTQLSGTLGYSYTDSSNEEDIVSVYVSSHAKHLITSNLILNHSKFNISLNSIFKNRNGSIASAINSQLEDSYFVLHGRVGLQLTEDFGLHVQLRNILDKTYQNILGAKMPGRWFMAGVNWTL